MIQIGNVEKTHASMAQNIEMEQFLLSKCDGTRDHIKIDMNENQIYYSIHVLNMTSLQIVSDIHLEFRGKQPSYEKILTKHGTDLILAGDIGRPFMTGNNRNIYADFIAYCAKTWRLVFVLTGNHCYYAKKRSEVNTKIKDICKVYENVHFLNDNAFHFTPDLGYPKHVAGIYGCTLWTNVTDLTFSEMNDKRIQRENGFLESRKSKAIDAETVREWHEEHVSKLRVHLKDADEKNQWIIATHHAPHEALLDPERSLNDQFFDNAYAANLPKDVFDFSKVELWISGHTHVHRDIEVEGIRCVSNCLGYPSQSPTKTGYLPGFQIDF